MIIKKYVADNMQDVLNMIRIELGPEAVIVSRRNVKQKGLLGIFKPKRLEITAAVDDVHKKPPTSSERAEEIRETYERREVERQLSEVKEMLQKLTEDRGRDRDREKDIEKEKEPKREKKTGIRKMLCDRDVSEESINKITSIAKSRDEYRNMTKVPDTAILSGIKDVLKVGPANEGRVHAFIGPTGVGKTTTIAKIAAMYSLNEKKKVGMITIDTYRIGAVEQLKIYADILGLPFEVVNSIDDIQKSMDNLKDCDMIFVDTTGRSIKNIMQLSELKLYLDRIKPDVTYLVISMTTKYNDLIQILNGFSTMDYNSVILTKLDETSTYGSLLNVACNTDVPISFITVGQNVPDDIEAATEDKLINLITGEVGI
jgi:flagellar biosynthesis protein FlhF